MATMMRGWIYVLTALAGSSVACQRPEERSSDANVMAQRDSQLQLARDSAYRLVEAERQASKPVELKGPTVVAFYPGVATSSALILDTLALPAVAPFRRRLERYRAAAGEAGYHFEVRESRGVRIIDPRASILDMFQIAADSVGLVVALPGEPLRVWYGLQLDATLSARLREVLPGARLEPPIGT